MFSNRNEHILSMYKEMIDYYLDNIHSGSKFSMGKVVITPRLIKNIVNRYNELVPNTGQIILNGELEDDGKKGSS